MKKQYRIRKNEEFVRIMSKKHAKSSGSFIVYFDSRQLDYARVGISVSKKMGDAVDRNRIKRQIREMIYSLFDFENSPVDIVVIVRKEYLNKDFSGNKADLEKLLKKAII